MKLTIELNPSNWVRIARYRLSEWRFRRIEKRGGQSFKDSDLLYAAYARCKCGAGMAYPKGCGGNHYWDCSDVLTGRAIESGKPGAVQHEAKLPFISYEIKSERQPSANGATTRKK